MASASHKSIYKGSYATNISNANNARKIDKTAFWQRLIPLPWEAWPSEARLLLALMVLWSIAGLFILGSASWWVASKEMGDGSYFIKRQLIWLIASWTIAWLAISINLRKWLKISKLCLISCLILVGATLIFGNNINGASRWLVIGPIMIQPSELVKPFLILQSAHIFAQWERVRNGQKLMELSIFGLLIILILKQPNLSTAALLGCLIWMIALSAGINFKNGDSNKYSIVISIHGDSLENITEMRVLIANSTSLPSLNEQREWTSFPLILLGNIILISGLAFIVIQERVREKGLPFIEGKIIHSKGPEKKINLNIKTGNKKVEIIKVEVSKGWRTSRLKKLPIINRKEDFNLDFKVINKRADDSEQLP